MQNPKTTLPGILAAVGVLLVAASQYLGAEFHSPLQAVGYLAAALGIGAVGVQAKDGAA